MSTHTIGFKYAMTVGIRIRNSVCMTEGNNKLAIFIKPADLTVHTSYLTHARSWFSAEIDAVGWHIAVAPKS